MKDSSEYYLNLRGDITSLRFKEPNQDSILILTFSEEATNEEMLHVEHILNNPLECSL